MSDSKSRLSPVSGRFTILAALLILVAACSPPADKNNSSNGDPNAGTNSSTNSGQNTATNSDQNSANVGTECEDNSDCMADQECVDGTCIDHLGCSIHFDDFCPDGTTLATVNGKEGCFADCDNGACPGEQECTQGICTGGSNASVPEHCVVEWTVCSDGKDYAVDCDGSECTCAVNDVEEGTFESTSDCSDDAFHRQVNAECGWVVPDAG